jgi:hypothetical protein
VQSIESKRRSASEGDGERERRERFRDATNASSMCGTTRCGGGDSATTVTTRRFERSGSSIGRIGVDAGGTDIELGGAGSGADFGDGVRRRVATRQEKSTAPHDRQASGARRSRSRRAISVAARRRQLAHENV